VASPNVVWPHHRLGIQNAAIGVVLTLIGIEPPVQIGGSARGYLELFAR
jgi:hypothetical protein